MLYAVYLKKSAEKELDRLPWEIHDRIVKRLISLRNNPRPLGTKKLLGREGYRIRVGNYRILYIINEEEKKVEIVSVAHRKEVYR
ncbi:type II toxin-antitoxin system RelE/ParE family toxin [candidate division WOR-3 bacterium]|nr:type II toxin-antitoxin system RelE/ParE family toxin [candidate division WOR-3 bacterium]